jgi:hypothetical protein
MMIKAGNLDFLEVLDTQSASTHPELLISAVLQLMSRYKVNNDENGPCLKLAAVIERHLQALASQPHLSAVLRATCLQLSELWAEQVDKGLPQPVKPSLLSRFGLGARP